MRSMPHLLLSSAVLLGSSLLAASEFAPSAWAGDDEVPTIAVVVLPDDDRQAGNARQLRRSFLALYRDSETVRLVDPFKPRVPERLGDRADELLRRGRDELEEGRYKAAVKDLGAALKEMTAKPGARLKAVLAEAMLYHAVALFGAGKRDRALRQLQELLTWRPRVDTRIAYPPKGWGRLVKQARAWLDSAETGSALVTSIPRQADVFIDGRALGPTPVVASNLVAGIHYLTLFADGHLRVVMPLEVIEGVQTTTSVRLKPDPRWSKSLPLVTEAKEALGEKQLPSRDRLRELLGAEQALFVTVGGGARLTIKAYLYDLEANQRLGQTEITNTGPLRAEQLGLLALWAPESAMPAPKVTRKREPRRTHRARPWYKRWWVWSAGAVGVAAAVGIPLALRSGSSASDEEIFEVRW